MATLPASTGSTPSNQAVRYAVVEAESTERLSAVAALRGKLTLFRRRRMLDWKSQVTRIIVVAAGSAMTFLAWKWVITWLA